MKLQELAQATLEIEYPGSQSLEDALDAATKRGNDLLTKIRAAQDTIDRLQEGIYQDEADFGDAERAAGLFLNAILERGQK